VENLVRFRQWVFSVDKAETERIYAAATASEAVLCGCGNCLNFEAARELAFPVEVRELFLELGIDYRREAEVFIWQSFPDGRQHYGGWFHFRGTIIAGPTLPQSDRQGPWLEPLNNSFGIGFCNANAPGFFSDLRGAAQLEFETYVPWLLTNAPAPD